MRYLSVYFTLFIAIGACSQENNTIGVLELDNDLVFNGYTLIFPENQENIFLINNCGQIINIWEGEDTQGPGKEAYLLSNGSVLSAKTQGGVYSNTFGTGGAGGIVEIRNWENEVEWSMVIADSLVRQHHDVHQLPNGNILAIVWERYGYDDIVDMGFDTINNNQDELWPDKIVEIDTSNNEIVWEWKSWDHLVQDFNPMVANFQSINEHPELININYQDFTFGRQDIHHINSIDYDSVNDLILLSCRNFNEVWIIDHSTSTEEAASHDGGNFGKGGDLIYRWGNPSAYNAGSSFDQKLFRPHYASFVNNDTDGQLISVYNNFIEQDVSFGQTILTEVANGDYVLDNNVFLPKNFKSTYYYPDTTGGFSTAGSSMEVLPNGNVIMCAARQGRIFEVNSDNKLVWEYLVPMRNGFSIEQGDTPSLSENFNFSAKKYDQDYSAFDGRDITPNGYIELLPNEDCILSSAQDANNWDRSCDSKMSSTLAYYSLFIDMECEATVRILSSTGQYVSNHSLHSGRNTIDISQLRRGFYFLYFDNNQKTTNFVKF